MWPLSFVLADDLTTDIFLRGMSAGLCVVALRG